MKDQQDYIQDIAEIRSMMERSSKFLSLSGWAGIIAGMAALAGAGIAHFAMEFRPDEILYPYPDLTTLIWLSLGVLVVALVGAIFDSYRKAGKRDEKAWNPTSRKMLSSMSVPLFAGGFLIVILISRSLLGLIAPLTLLFYGLSLFNAGFYTVKEVRIMGLFQMLLGLLNLTYIEFGLLFWALGFGLVHILYGIFMHLRYER
ncbi:hypothetical protein [Gracilimonas amylolytica]|uniref:hypothetical protein n=1 Tax=Gracilimonas amylolytica TaxID=1749045 RepID=UPI000CD876F5|nr:hypothetical protein [Gracilimonas amylolytica]